MIYTKITATITAKNEDILAINNSFDMSGRNIFLLNLDTDVEITSNKPAARKSCC